MRLTAIQKAQIKRERDKVMEELKLVVDRVRLTTGEFHTAEAELGVVESPDPEYEAQEEERQMRERKMKRRKRRKEKRREEHREEREASQKETQGLVSFSLFQ